VYHLCFVKSNDIVRQKKTRRKKVKGMKDQNCIFCKIAAGEIPSATLYEDDDFRVILDIEPASKGHALILPKEHYANLYELDDEVAAKALVLAKKMITKLTDIVGCDGYNVLQNNGTAAGQTVFHFHMHLIPRYKNDDVKVGWKPGKLTDEVKQEILAKINE
jgi:histidine triad (HIT) family protein